MPAASSSSLVRSSGVTRYVIGDSLIGDYLDLANV